MFVCKVAKVAYHFGVPDTNDCQDRHQAISTDEECQSAFGDLIGATAVYKGTDARGDRPGGCWKEWNGNANFNPDAGSATSGRTPICKSTSDGQFERLWRRMSMSHLTRRFVWFHSL